MEQKKENVKEFGEKLKNPKEEEIKDVMH